MRKAGTQFEWSFKNSIDKDDSEIFFYRFKDSLANWNRNENTQFQPHNVCDCMIFYNGKLFLCELKKHKGKSLPLKCIRPTQIDEMNDADNKKGIYSFVVIFFEDVGECYAVRIKDVVEACYQKSPRSISLKKCKESGFPIPCRKMKVNYKYDIKTFLDAFIKTID